jgi:hypothetical protein
MRRLNIALGMAAAAALLAGPGFAAEEITYSYDAKGRLTKVARSGGVNSGVTSDYSHDRADNRAQLTVAGSTNRPPGSNAPLVSVGDAAAVTEGSSLFFTLTRDGDASVPATVYVYADTTSGTATAGSDYGWFGSNYTFAPGVTSVNLSVATFADSSAEGPETVIVRVRTPSAGTYIGDAEGVGTISGP